MLRQHPKSDFVKSLYDHYCNRGGLSRKQLEGIYAKAGKAKTLSPARLATLEAIIKKKPVRERSAATIKADLPGKDENLGKMINNILEKYPQHKRLLFFRSKYDNNEAISAAEAEEIKKFDKLLLK